MTAERQTYLPASDSLALHIKAQNQSALYKNDYSGLSPRR